MENFEDEIKKTNLDFQLGYFEFSLKKCLCFYKVILEYKEKDKLIQLKPQVATSVRQPQFHYNQFLESGLNIFINVIDVYQLWLEPKDMVPLLKQSEPEALSYTLIATLARYTISRESSLYKTVYRNSLKNAKKSLPKAYSQPSLNNIVALGLITYLYMSHFKFELTIRYFGASIKMAQTLGLDKIEDEDIINSLDPEVKEFKRKGQRLWNALSLTYMVLSTISPDLPSFNFVPKPFTLTQPSRANFTVKYSNISGTDYLKREEFFTTDIGQKLTEVFMMITCHVQQIKANYSQQELANIPSVDLRLPLNEFNKAITTLLSIQDYCYTEDGIPAENSPEHTRCHNSPETVIAPHEVCSFNIRQRVIFEALYIYLYYPNILAYPQPVDTTRDEERLLYRSANHLTQHFIYLYQEQCQADPELKALTVEISKQQSNTYQVNYESPHYLQCLCAVYVYFNLLHKLNMFPKDTLYQGFKALAMTNSLAMIKVLVLASQLCVKKDFSDAYSTLQQIQKSYKRFGLPEMFAMEVEALLKEV